MDGSPIFFSFFSSMILWDGSTPDEVSWWSVASDITTETGALTLDWSNHNWPSPTLISANLESSCQLVSTLLSQQRNKKKNYNFYKNILWQFQSRKEVWNDEPRFIILFSHLAQSFTISQSNEYLHLCFICLQSKRLMPSQQWLLSSFLDFSVPCSPHLSIPGLLVVIWLLAMNINDTWSQLLPARVTHNSVLSSINIIQSKHWTLSIIKCYYPHS